MKKISFVSNKYITNGCLFIIFMIGFFLCKTTLCSSFVYHCNVKSYSNNQVIPNWVKIIVKDDNEIRLIPFKSNENLPLYQTSSKGILGNCSYEIDNSFPVNIKIVCFDNTKTFFHYQINNNKIIPIESRFDYMGYTFFSIFIGLLFAFFSKKVMLRYWLTFQKNQDLQK